MDAMEKKLFFSTLFSIFSAYLWDGEIFLYREWSIEISKFGKIQTVETAFVPPTLIVSISSCIANNIVLFLLCVYTASTSNLLHRKFRSIISDSIHFLTLFGKMWNASSVVFFVWSGAYLLCRESISLVQRERLLRYIDLLI